MKLAAIAGALLCATAAPAHAATLVVLAPHPDDAEASCGGLAASAAAAGQEVVIVAMTGGERGVGGKGLAEARELRLGEARRAAAVLGARLETFGGMDGELTADAAAADRLGELLLRLRAATVLAPWPLDVHPDHQATGQLAWRALHDRRQVFELWFYETANLPHTTSFRFVPTDLVDVTEVADKKREATMQHRSQDPAAWYVQYQDLMRVRGYEADVALAEGYVKARSSSGLGGRPGVTPRLLGDRAAAPPAPPPPPPPPPRPVEAADWAGLAFYRADNQRVGAPAPGERRVVFYGDSIVEAWPRIAPEAFAGRPWIGRGISGQTTAQLLLRFAQDVVALRPRAVVLMAGTNDVAGNAGPYREEETVANLAAMADLARAHGIGVVLAEVLPARDYPWRPGQAPAPRIAALNARLGALAAERGLAFLAWHGALSDGEGGLRADLGDDGVHPNRAGYARMAPLAEKALRQALSSRPAPPGSVRR